MRLGLSLLQTAALLAWSGFLLHLWLSGDLTRYVGARTEWVVPFGAVALGLAAFGSLVSIRRSHGRPSLAQALAPAIVLIPLVAVALAPSAELGAYAAAKKFPPPPPVAAASAPLHHVVHPKQGKLTFMDLQTATQYDDTAWSVGVVAGMPVDLTGFVTHPKGSPPGTFGLTRFVIWCCLADALADTAQVKSSADYPDDTWLHVRGETRKNAKRIVVVPATVDRVGKPSDPYMRTN